MSSGFAGKLVLMAITVTAATGGFTLGYFVGKNASSSRDSRAVPEVAIPRPSGTGTQVVEGEPKTATPSEVQAIKEEKPPLPESEPSREAVKAAPAPGGNKEQLVRPEDRDRSVQPDPAAPDKGVGEQKTGASGVLYVVQVGAFKSRKEADHLKDRLEARGYKAKSSKVTERGQVYFKVVVGEFSRKKEAEVLAVKLKKTEGLKAFVSRKT